VSSIRAVAAPDRREFAARFASVPALQTLVNSVLEGRCGGLSVDPAGQVGAAWVIAPPFWFPVGPAHGPPADEFVELIHRFGGAVVADDAWYARVRGRCAERSSVVRRTPFSAAQLSLDDVRSLLAARPEQVTVARVDAPRAAELSATISPDLVFATSFPTPADFEAGGIGFCTIVNDHPVAAATSAFVCDGAIEIQVNTLPEFRGRGFARLACAALIVSCLERGIAPNWDTGDPISHRLARRLGYVALPVYDVLEVSPP